MIDDWTTPPYRELLIYKLLNPDFQVFQASSPADFWSGLTGRTRRLERGYRFQGTNYPDYRVLSATQFTREKKLEGCPEILTHDLAFTRSYFWWTHVATVENTGLYDLVADLNVELARHGRRLHVVVLPTNLGLIRRFDPAWADRVRADQKKLVAALTARQVRVIDLSDTFTPDEFTGQWCACIHLTQKGRLHLTMAIAADLPVPRAERLARMETPTTPTLSSTRR
jgi:hypothetical protein